MRSQASPKWRLLDLFCGAGGASAGYAQAGFDVVGVDIRPQPRYPYVLVQGDALDVVSEIGTEFDVIHASPPCQLYSKTRHLTMSLGTARPYDESLLVRTYERLMDLLRCPGKPYAAVIENVPGAELDGLPVVLCGTAFGLRVIRHRKFWVWAVDASGVPQSQLILAPPCAHVKGATTNAHRGKSAFSEGAYYICVAGRGFDTKDARRAMGIDWMTGYELAQAIPPVYTKFLGDWLASYLEEVVGG